MQEFALPSEQSLPDRMSDGEAQEVLRLYLQRTEGTPELSTADVAEAIRLPETEVRQLLAEVRRRKAQAAEVKPAKKRKLRDLSVAIISAVVFLAMVSVLWIWSHGNQPLHISTGTVTNATGFVLEMGDRAVVLPTPIKPTEAYQNNDLVNVIDHEILSISRPSGSQAAFRAFDDKTLLQNLNNNHWDTPGIRFMQFKIRVNGASPDLYDDSFSMPIYQGSEPKIEKIVDTERQYRIREALKNVSQKARVIYGG